MAAIRLALVDYHASVRSGIKILLEQNDAFNVDFESATLEELLSSLTTVKILPDIIVMDIKMPGMTVVNDIRYLKINFPQISIVVFSMLNHIDVISELIATGVTGYVSKLCNAKQLTKAMYSALENIAFIEGSEEVTSIKSLNTYIKVRPFLSQQDRIFLNLCTTELSYTEIASKLNVSPRTVNGYREKLFNLLNIHSRTGLAMYAVRNGIAQ